VTSANPSAPRKPTRGEIEAAVGATVPDVLAPGLTVLFVGINPGLYSGAVGHHFARPGNRFWRALAGAGFTDRVLTGYEDGALLDFGLGITNVVERATAGAVELADEELRAGVRGLEAKVRRHRPAWVAFLGMGMYRVAFDDRQAVLGEQPGRLADARVWVLPNPSGLNAHYQVPDLIRLFAELRAAADAG
jgi:TDG/mug DNA glycosylase family protein